MRRHLNTPRARRYGTRARMTPTAGAETRTIERWSARRGTRNRRTRSPAPRMVRTRCVGRGLGRSRRCGRPLGAKRRRTRPWDRSQDRCRPARLGRVQAEPQDAEQLVWFWPPAIARVPAPPASRAVDGREHAGASGTLEHERREAHQPVLPEQPRELHGRVAIDAAQAVRLEADAQHLDTVHQRRSLDAEAAARGRGAVRRRPAAAVRQRRPTQAVQ